MQKKCKDFFDPESETVDISVSQPLWYMSASIALVGLYMFVLGRSSILQEAASASESGIWREPFHLAGFQCAVLRPLLHVIDLL